MEVAVQEYIDESGRSPFAEWFDKLNAPAAAKVSTALYRMQAGNFSNVKSLRGGLFEYKINFGPGYRIYFGQHEDRLIILFGGGTKKQQNKDIDRARAAWKQYKHRKRNK